MGVGGRLLLPSLRSAVDLARCILRRPDIFIIDGSVGGSHESLPILEAVRAEMAGRSLIVTLAEDVDRSGFDQILTFDGPQLQMAVDGRADEEARFGQEVAVAAS